MKAEWIFTIVKALEGRIEYLEEKELDEKRTCEEALNYFKDLEIKP